MPEKYTYLLVDAGCIIFPFLFSFHPRIRFYKQWRFFVLPCIATAVFFMLWDILFTAIGVWDFNPAFVCGLFFAGLPIEEYLFFICIPYACTFTYYCISKFFTFSAHSTIADVVSRSLIVFLCITAFMHPALLYTSVTFVLLAMVLWYLIWRQVPFMAAFYISFLLILLPFFVSNGILTGSFIREPVVNYNGAYNMGFRMFTIPFEDTFYGMLLLLLNVAGYEKMKARAARKQLA